MLLETCNSAEVGSGASGIDLTDERRQALYRGNVTVLTSSDKHGWTRRAPGRGHGPLALAFLDALSSAGDPNGVVRTTALINKMDLDIPFLTDRQETLGQHANFGGNLFMAKHY